MKCMQKSFFYSTLSFVHVFNLEFLFYNYHFEFYVKRSIEVMDIQMKKITHYKHFQNYLYTVKYNMEVPVVAYDAETVSITCNYTALLAFTFFITKFLCSEEIAVLLCNRGACLHLGVVLDKSESFVQRDSLDVTILKKYVVKLHSVGHFSGIEVSYKHSGHFGKGVIAVGVVTDRKGVWWRWVAQTDVASGSVIGTIHPGNFLGEDLLKKL